jgi:hypothetical protein
MGTLQVSGGGGEQRPKRKKETEPMKAQKKQK